jgi:hypothetical protein
MDTPNTTSRRVGLIPFKYKDQELANAFTALDTEWGYTIVTIQAGADPAKRSQEWHEAQLAAMLGDVKDYRREYAIDWTSASGDVFYPEFARNPERYVAPVKHDPNKPVYRGWDFGFRHPACVWFQKDSFGRCLVLREVMPDNIDTYSFRDLVLYLSGSLDLKVLQRRPRAYQWLRKLEQAEWEFQGKTGKYPRPPWFAPTQSFIDHSGPECYAASKIEGEKGERNDAEVLASEGIYLNVLSTRVSAREAVVRRLLLPGDGGRFGLVLHPSCEILIGGLAGGICYAEGTDRNPEPTEPAKNGWHEHVHDAFGYGVINVFPVGENSRGDARTNLQRGGTLGRIVRSPKELARQGEPAEQYMDETILDGQGEEWF